MPLASVVTTVDASPPTSQVPAVVSSGQTAGIVGPVAGPPTPLVVIKQPEPVRIRPTRNTSNAFVFVTNGILRLNVLATSL